MQQQNEDSITAEDALALAAAKKENILERLNKRNKDRQNYLDVKSEQRSKENLQLEGVDYFSHTFAERVREVQTRIQNITDAAAKKNTGDAPNPDLARIFSDITVEIQELQRYLTTSTMFLSDYKIKACQNILNELTTSSEETRVKLLPKKKFGFSGKKSSKPAKVKEVATPTDKLDAGSLSTLSNTIFSWTISNRSNEYICLTENEVNGKDLTISALDHCFVELQGHPGSLQITNASHCVFLCGPIARSLFAEFCSDSSIAGACQQLRLHSSRNMQLYIHVTCRAIIEDCKEIKVSTYNYEYPSMAEDFVAAGLDRSHNNYTDIADFNWLSPDVPSPNWHLVKDIQQSAPDWQQLRSSFKEQQQNGSGLNNHNL